MSSPNHSAPGTKFIWLAIAGVPLATSLSLPSVIYGHWGALDQLRATLGPMMSGLPELAALGLIVLAFYINRRPENLERSYISKEYRRRRVITAVVTLLVGIGLWAGAAVTSPIIPGAVGYGKLEYALTSIGFLLVGAATISVSFVVAVFAMSRPVRPEPQTPAI